MKWLIYSLLLLNLAFGLWHLRSQQVRFVEEKNDDENLRLVLLSEFNKQNASTSADVEMNEQNDARCYTLGPFKTTAEAATLRKELETLGIKAQRRMSKDNSRKGFWVLLPPETTRRAAEANVKLLKEKGIKDYFLVVTGEQVNAISLGVFSKSELAQRRYEEIKALDFAVKIDKVDLPLREYWLDWPVEQKLLPAVLEKFRQSHAGIGQTERVCGIPAP